MKLIASDMDRTLLPNGKEEMDPNSMKIFKNEIRKNKLGLVYVTGRYKSQIKDALERYDLPQPYFIISLLGTVIYDFREGKFDKIEEWEEILERDWKDYKREDIENFLQDISGIRTQENKKLNKYKQSYYFDLDCDIAAIKSKIKKRLGKRNIEAEIIESVDVNKRIGLLDIVPKSGTKISALKYIMKKLNVGKDRVLYAGDSGNDLLPLTSGVYAVLVKNAPRKTKERLKKVAKEKKIEDRIHIATGTEKLSGNYVSGIIEGARKFNFFKN